VAWDTPWPLDAWPDVPTKFILCKDDQFFPAAFMRRLAQQRLGIIPDEVPGCSLRRAEPPQQTQRPSRELPRLTGDRRPATAAPLPRPHCSHPATSPEPDPRHERALRGRRNACGNRVRPGHVGVARHGEWRHVRAGIPWDRVVERAVGSEAFQ
jgi:hypothetical protein